MKEKLLSAHIDSDGDVIAMTKVACYRFSQKLKEPQKLIDKLTKIQEIDPQHWIVEWSYSGVDISQEKESKKRI